MVKALCEQPGDQRHLRRRRRHHHPPRRRAYRHRHADAGRPDRAGRAPRRGARRLGLRRRRSRRLAEAARTGTAARDELSGSTITISSLGALGGIVSTPVINHPEVAIIGVNKIAVRPVWDGTQFVPRKMMNLVLQLRPPHRRRLGRGDLHPAASRRCSKRPALIFIEG